MLPWRAPLPPSPAVRTPSRTTPSAPYGCEPDRPGDHADGADGQTSRPCANEGEGEKGVGAAQPLKKRKASFMEKMKGARPWC